MSAPAARVLERLPTGHPCERCGARAKALCRVLDCESLADFKRMGSTLRLPAGQALFREGEAATRVFTLTGGSLKLHKQLGRRGSHVVGFLGTGDFLGVSVNGKRSFSAEMLEPGEICSVAIRRFRTFIADHPAIEQELYRIVEHEGQRQRALLQAARATQRLATFLLLQTDQFEPSEDDQGNIVELPMSRADLADYLDLGEHTLASMFSRFEVVRLIRSPNSRQVEILNRPLLMELAGGWLNETNSKLVKGRPIGHSADSGSSSSEQPGR